MITTETYATAELFYKLIVFAMVGFSLLLVVSNFCLEILAAWFKDRVKAKYIQIITSGVLILTLLIIAKYTLYGS